MKMNFHKLVIGVSIAIGVSALATVPAQAGTLTGATIGGTAATDYLVYDSNATNTFKVGKTSANVQKVLSGNADSPTGNVELRASSEGSFEFDKNTTLTGQIGGKNITLSSLTEADWFSTGSGIDKKFGANNFANTWFKEFAKAAGLTGNSVVSAYSAFLDIKGFERSSDPNISYVNQDDSTGDIKIGLAGHMDLKAYYATPTSPFKSLANFVKKGFQASEVVKVTYNDKTDFLYSFSATATKLKELSDGSSHSGNYEVGIKGVAPAAVPEPSVMLGLLGVAGVFVTQRKLKKASI